MENPGGYVYRVGQRIGTKAASRKQALFEVPAARHDPEVEPALGPALASLSHRQRTIVVLVHALGMSQAEAADWLDVTFDRAETPRTGDATAEASSGGDR